MLKIALSGCSGRMGRVISDIVCSRDGMEIVVGFDIRTEQYADFPIYKDFAEYQGDCDVVIDFSNAALTERLLDYCEARRLPVVICTTGHSAEQLDRIRAASASIPIFRSGNMSIGINLMSELLKKSASVLGDKYDVEIIEKHHNQKLDAPSGTAIMLADAVASALPYKAEYVYDRHERREKRPAHEIGISASAAARSSASTACCSAAATRSSRSSTPRFPVRFSRLALSMQPSTWRPARSPACMI